MYFEGIAEQITQVEKGARDDWNILREDIVREHSNATSESEHTELLGYYTRLMDVIEGQINDIVDLEKFRQARLNEYNLLLTGESTVGGSICIETLYDITQRELESGRMLPTHEFIDMTIDAMASSHYSKDRLQFQEQRNREKQNTPNIFRRLFKNK